jgi:RNA polymerase sigma-70 factor (ECF subfamily)
VTEDESFRDLIRRLRAGEQAAAADFVRLYEPEILRFIRVHLNNSRLRRFVDSADIFQSVFLNFFVRVTAGQYDLDSPEQVIRLLVTMARNRIVDHARRPQAQEGGSGLWGRLAAPGDSPSDAVARQEILQEVLRRLTGEERDLAEQRGEGRSWQEIADALGSTPDAVRKKLERALDRVCQELSAGGDSHA